MPVTASPTVPGAILLRKTAKTMPNSTEFIMVPHAVAHPGDQTGDHCPDARATFPHNRHDSATCAAHFALRARHAPARSPARWGFPNAAGEDSSESRIASISKSAAAMTESAAP